MKPRDWGNRPPNAASTVEHVASHQADDLHRASRRLHRSSVICWIGALGIGILRQYLAYGIWGALITVVLGVVVAPAFIWIGRRPDDGMRSISLVVVCFAWATLVLLASVPFAHAPNTGVNQADSRSSTIEAAVLSAVLTAGLAIYAGIRYGQRKHDSRDMLKRIADN
jgi:hypothetical protein